MNYKEIWKKTEEDLKTSLPAHAYEAWIETLSPVGVTNQIFILEAVSYTHLTLPTNREV